ncbi:MAG: hypothetical protein ABI673_09920, partial [Novosphingobium sp.]
AESHVADIAHLLFRSASYTTYLLHWSILLLIGTAATANGWTPGPRLFLLMLAAIPLTIVFQEPIYRWIEAPGRALGKKWARALGATSVAELSQESFERSGT